MSRLPNAVSSASSRINAISLTAAARWWCRKGGGGVTGENQAGLPSLTADEQAEVVRLLRLVLDDVAAGRLTATNRRERTAVHRIEGAVAALTEASAADARAGPPQVIATAGDALAGGF